MASATPHLDLDELSAGSAGCTPAYGHMLGECCVFCFDKRGHKSGVAMRVEGQFDVTARVHWSTGVTEQLRLCYHDEPDTAEKAAYGIAFLLVRRLAGLQFVERSRKGTGFDYWIGPDGSEDLPFQQLARLEVSGLLDGDRREFRARIRKKVEQTKRSDGMGIPAYVVVVEFGEPQSHLGVRP